MSGSLGRADWRGRPDRKVVVVHGNPAIRDDYLHGITMLTGLTPSPFVIQPIGICRLRLQYAVPVSPLNIQIHTCDTDVIMSEADKICEPLNKLSRSLSYFLDLELYAKGSLDKHASALAELDVAEQKKVRFQLARDYVSILAYLHNSPLGRKSSHWLIGMLTAKIQ